MQKQQTEGRQPLPNYLVDEINHIIHEELATGLLMALRQFYDKFLQREEPFNEWLHRDYRMLESLIESIDRAEFDRYYISRYECEKGMLD